MSDTLSQPTSAPSCDAAGEEAVLALAQAGEVVAVGLGRQSAGTATAGAAAALAAIAAMKSASSAGPGWSAPLACIGG